LSQTTEQTQSLDSLASKLLDAQQKSALAISTLTDTIRSINDAQAQAQEKLNSLSAEMQFINSASQPLDKEQVKEFWKQPYVIVPRRKSDEWYVCCPTFVPFQIGWLEKTINGWNYFIVNKYMHWLGKIPDELKKVFDLKEPLPVKISHDMDFLLTENEQFQEQAWERYSKFLYRREGKDKIAIKKGYEFDLIASMINDGILPFLPRPVDSEDLREAMLTFTLRAYQEKCLNAFLQYGAIGIFYPPGSGKTYMGINALARIKGRKCIVVPTLTLIEQWKDRIEKFIPQRKSEIDIITYNGYEKVRDNTYTLTIYDECHRLPANSYSKLSTIRTKYRIGLSATPLREDGRTDYIFALTGYPVGTSWQELIAKGIIRIPLIRLYIVQDERDKIAKIKEILAEKRKTIIYSYWLELGSKIAKQFNLPFINGATTNRLEALKNAEIAVVSSVGGEGLSLPDLERVIEAGFQYGSRREEAQLLGRLFHSEKKDLEHIILMTERELESYEKRLYAIREQNFRLEIVR